MHNFGAVLIDFSRLRVVIRRIFRDFSDETNQGDGEMASIDGGLIRDLRFDSFQ